MKARTTRWGTPRRELSDPQSPQCPAAGRVPRPPLAAGVVLAVSLLLAHAPAPLAAGVGLAGLALGIRTAGDAL